MEKLKALLEKRNSKIDAMNALTNAAITETRALTEVEDGTFKELEGEVHADRKSTRLNSSH